MGGFDFHLEHRKAQWGEEEEVGGGSWRGAANLSWSSPAWSWTVTMKFTGVTHCPMGVSTRPAWHSEFYAWLFLLWPRLIQNSCWINLKGGAFWENLSSVVTSLDSRKTNWEIIKRTFLLAIRGITVNIVTTTEILIPVQAFLKAFIASYFLFLGDIQCWPNKTQRFYFHQG